MIICKFNLENPCTRLKVKVAWWVQQRIGSHPFCSMLIIPPILGIWLFHNMTFEVRGQYHKSRSHSGLNILSTHHFHSMSINPPIPEIQLYQNLTLKIQGQGHGWGQSSKSQRAITSYRLTFLSFHVNWPPQIAFWNLALTIQGQGHSSKLKVT